jgi:TolA-binding protein
MKYTIVLPTLVVILLLSPFARAQSSDIEELKAAIKAMQKTIADQNAKLSEQSSRIATLEKQQQPPARQKLATKGAAPAPASGRSVTVAGMNVPVPELPVAAIPKARTPATISSGRLRV